MGDFLLIGSSLGIKDLEREILSTFLWPELKDDVDSFSVFLWPEPDDDVDTSFFLWPELKDDVDFFDKGP